MNAIENKTFKIQLVTSWPIEEIVALYKAGHWWREWYHTSQISSLIAQSFAFAVAVDTTTGKAVGMGRVLSDGISDAYIQDVVLLPKYRKYGLGTKLVQMLISQCKKCGIHWIGCIAEPGIEQFYKELGFRPMKGHTAMLLQEE